MAETLSELFQESAGQPITVSGKLVHSIYKRSVKAGSIFKIKRLSHTSEIVQGLRIKCDAGKLKIDEQALVDIVLWADTSPADVTISVQAKSETTVKFWNVWRYKEIMQAWVGNAGICVEEDGKRTRLRCSDGIGEADFEDLLVDVEFAE